LQLHSPLKQTKAQSMNLRTGIFVVVLFFTRIGNAQLTPYPQNYFRHPLNIPMQLVANFGEIRTNHWHMGLDIRTQHKVNLPVYAAAAGYVARVSVEPGGFGQAIYINHPNGFTTLYGHLNSFFPALAAYVKQQQYNLQRWNVNLILPPDLFVIQKGQLIALSGSTGASEGPHVHFEIRDSQTENCLNPLLFRFPIADRVPPTVLRLALYDRNRSTYEQSPRIFALKRSGSNYSVSGSPIRVGSDKISFAIGAVDHFSGTTNPNGIYGARILMDGQVISQFMLDDISYNDTRYINAQLDYPYKARGGSSLQHITPLPGATSVAYRVFNDDGAIHLTDDAPHAIIIEVRDANENVSRISFTVQLDPQLGKAYAPDERERFLPNNVNVFERENFELFTTERTIYDTVPVQFTTSATNEAGAVSSIFNFMSSSIPVHDSIRVRIKPAKDLGEEERNRIVIRSRSGSRTSIQKARWENGWLSASFRQFGTFEALVDNEPPTINAPSLNLSKASRIVFVPRDNFDAIRSFRAEVDGQWLRFSNDKGRSWIYNFDEHFPRGSHELTVVVEDEAGNRTTRTWTVNR
jgi:murein DD-endopeptidase MepM/ murein hydrolase activator NlpD